MVLHPCTYREYLMSSVDFKTEHMKLVGKIGGQGTNWRMGIERICSQYIICRNEFLKIVKWFNKEKKKKTSKSRYSSSVEKKCLPSPLLPVFTASRQTECFELSLSRHVFLMGQGERQTTSRALPANYALS